MTYTVHRIHAHTVIAYDGKIIAHGATTLEPDTIENLLRDLVFYHPDGKVQDKIYGQSVSQEDEQK
jgi:hypothetical protein